MSMYLVQAGTTLYSMTQAGVGTALTLPASITLDGMTNPCRATLFQVGDNPLMVVVNGGTHDFYIDTFGNVRQLQIAPPTTYPVPTAGVGTDLTGVYRVACTFKVKDSNGATVLETAMGPLSTPTASLTTKTIALANIPVSGDATVNARGLYRTLAGGTTLYPWFDIDNNTTLTEDRGVADSVLSLIPAQAVRYGTPPDLKLITAWRGRLWGVPRLAPDFLRWTEDRNFYGWSADNELLVPPQNADAFGVTALIPRRDELGIGRRDALFSVRGNSNTSFQRVGISETIGPINQESVVVVYNTGYFLTRVGIAEWTDAGVGYITQATVDAWFTSDTYFNRAMFPSAQGRYNPRTDSVEFLLASAGSSTLDRWIAFNLKTRIWMGPHKTDAFTIACAANTAAFRGGLSDTNGLTFPVFGATNGYLYKRDESVVTDDGTAVAMSVTLPSLSDGQPDVEKVWGQWTLHSRAETQGTLAVSPAMGALTAPAGASQQAQLTVDRQVMPRLGKGRYAKLTLTHSATTERPRIYGLELPYIVVGRR